MTEALLFWDDIAVGATRSGGAFHFSTDSIKRFATEYDPRPTHLDEAAAEASFFKGVSASGAQTFAAWARLYWELTRDWATQASTRMAEMRLLRPVRPGDVVRLTVEVTGKREHPLERGFGFLDTRHEMQNQRGEPVFRIECTLMMERRPA